MCTITWGVFLNNIQTTRYMTERLKWSKRNKLTLKHISQCTESRADEEQKQVLLSSKVWYILAHMALHHCTVCALGQISRAETTASQREVEVEGAASCSPGSDICHVFPLTHPVCILLYNDFQGVDCFNGILIASSLDTIC